MSSGNHCERSVQPHIARVASDPSVSRRLPGRATAGLRAAGFTLLELLTAISIVAVLAALLLPALNVIRRQAAMTSATSEVRQLALSIETYRTADDAKRYPVPQSDGALSNVAPVATSTALLPLLESHGGPVPRVRPLDGQGRLVDPWGRPYRYALVRPVVSDPASLARWNYDAALGHERAWGRRWDPMANAITLGALPFPYVYSCGPEGRTDVAAGWVVVEDLK